MKLEQAEQPLIFLHAGEYRISKEPEIISTVLGSCISVILFCRQNPVCGITHSQLPSCKHDPSFCIKCEESFRYADCSIIKLVQKMEGYQISINDMEAKIFGGAGIISNVKTGRDNVGRQNVEAAISTLKKEKIKIVAQDVGGSKGRKLFFFSETKEVLIKKLNGNKYQQ